MEAQENELEDFERFVELGAKLFPVVSIFSPDEEEVHALVFAISEKALDECVEDLKIIQKEE